MANRKISERIPSDLIIEIFTRLPAKSIARFRCVSKLYSSTFRSPDFANSFFTISSSRPKLLFTCMLDGITYFFSSPNPSTTSAYLIADGYMSFPINCPSDMSRPIHGLVCGLKQESSWGKVVTFPLICKPSTGQFVTLPKVKTRRKSVTSCFGYDPVNKEFKVLCMTQSPIGNPYCEEHQILTLGTLSSEWRMVECDIRMHSLPHMDTRHSGICINGVMYYLGKFYEEDDWLVGVVSFDIRSEKFKFITQDQGMDIFSGLALVNYKGKLGSIYHCLDGCRIYKSFHLWVLEDVDKHQWSQYIFDLPSSWMNTVRVGTNLRVIGMTSIGEIVLSTDYIAYSFYLIYYNPEKNSVAMVEIQGMGAFKEEWKAFTFLDYVEDVKLNQMFKVITDS